VLAASRPGGSFSHRSLPRQRAGQTSAGTQPCHKRPDTLGNRPQRRPGAAAITRSRLSRTTSLWHGLGLVGATDQSDGVSGALDAAKHQARRTADTDRQVQAAPTTERDIGGRRLPASGSAGSPTRSASRCSDLGGMPRADQPILLRSPRRGRRYSPAGHHGPDPAAGR
jgi:hypothetical protein